MALETHEEGINRLKEVTPNGTPFGCSVVQRRLGYGYNRSWHLMEYAVESGVARWENGTSISFI